MPDAYIIVISFFITLATESQTRLDLGFQPLRLTWLDESVVMILVTFLLQEGKSIQPDQAVGDSSTTAKLVADGLRDHDYNLAR